ncbi:MAG: hypothetical protein AB2551_12565 [Candidatus Thiodiazotropha sp.]
MSKMDPEIRELFMELKKELEIDPAGSSKLSTVAALMVLACELKGVKIELGRIAHVLGADCMTAGEISQSDTPSTMLSLLAALKATQT